MGEKEDREPEEGVSAKVDEDRENTTEVAKTEGVDDAGVSARTSECASQPRGSTAGANEMPDLLEIVQTTCATLAEKVKSHLLEQQSNPIEPSRSVHDPLPGARLSPAAILAAQAARRLLGEVEAAACIRPRGTCMMHASAAAQGHSECMGSAFQDSGLSPQWFDLSTPPLVSREEASFATSAAGSSRSISVVVGGAEDSHGCSSYSAASSSDMCDTMHLDARLDQVLSGRECLDQSAAPVGSHLSLEEWVDNVLRGVDDGCPFQQTLQGAPPLTPMQDARKQPPRDASMPSA